MANYNKDRLRDKPLSLMGLTDSMLDDGAEVVEVVREIVVSDPNAIQRHEDGTMTYKRFAMTSTGMLIPEDVQPEELADVAEVIHGFATPIQWIIGDLILATQKTYGDDKYLTIAEQWGYEVKTVQEYASVCRGISIRMENLSFGHHQKVRALDSDLQVQWLTWARDNGISSTELGKRIAEWKREQKGDDVTPAKNVLKDAAVLAAKNWKKLEKLDVAQKRELIQMAREILRRLDN